MKTSCCYNKILNTLKALHVAHPTYTMGQNLSTALDTYGDIWSMSDKEILFAIEKYAAELEYDVPHQPEDIDKIIEEGMHLYRDTLDSLDEEESFE